MRTRQSVLFSVVFFVTACGGGTNEVAPVSEGVTDKLVIYTVNYPLAYFAERIGGDLVEVHFPAPTDGDPAFWSPDADTIGFQCYELVGTEIPNPNDIDWIDCSCACGETPDCDYDWQGALEDNQTYTLLVNVRP